MGNMTQFLDNINYTRINESIQRNLGYLNLSDFWKVKEPVEQTFGGAIYFLFYFVVLGVILIKSRNIATATYVGVLLGVVLFPFIPNEFKPFMFGMVALMAAGAILYLVLER